MADLPGTRDVLPDTDLSNKHRLAEDPLPIQTMDRLKPICRFVLEKTVHFFRWDGSLWWLHPLSL